MNKIEIKAGFKSFSFDINDFIRWLSYNPYYLHYDSALASFIKAKIDHYTDLGTCFVGTKDNLYIYEVETHRVIYDKEMPEDLKSINDELNNNYKEYMQKHGNILSKYENR